MSLRMVSLTKARNGDWFARKGIPADVRAAYKDAYGVSQEERFRRPSSLSEGQAKAEFRDWDATISSRIEALRAAASGSAVQLSRRQRAELIGDWYGWFVAQHEDEPGSPEDWDIMAGLIEDAYSRFSSADDEEGDDDAPPSPVVRRHVRAKVLEHGRVASFLAERALRLDTETEDAFLDELEDDLLRAFAVLRRRAGGDYSADGNVHRFPKGTMQPVAPATGVKLASLDCWQLFEAWVHERKPGESTVNRWRSVFLAMNATFEGRDIATVTVDDVLRWKGELVTDERSAKVVNEVWLRASGVVFNWAVENRYIATNPFNGVRVATSKKQLKKREREFHDHEWRTILRATTEPGDARLAPHNAAARRWVPWLCAYTGARPGEITQLRGVDVTKEGHLWVVTLTPDAGTMKDGAARRVPLHEHLIEMGFPQFVEASGAGPLFYDPKAKRVERDDPTNPSRPLSVKARNKLAEWVRALGVDDRGISPSHAWRHTFKRRAKRAGIDRITRFAICGHSTRDVGDIYELPTLADMAEALKLFPRYDLEEPAGGGAGASGMFSGKFREPNRIEGLQRVPPVGRLATSESMRRGRRQVASSLPACSSGACQT